MADQGDTQGPTESRVGPVPVEICVQHLSRSFGSHVVLSGVDLTIYSGDIVAIVGGSGSGKTVLLDHMTGLLPAEAGRVVVADHDDVPGPSGPPLVDLATAPPEKLDAIRLHWSVVFQRNALFSGTVLENIALWLSEHTNLTEGQIRERTRESLRSVALDPDDVMNKDRDLLSGGMAKRVAIARAIATNPIVVFYDEPTTGLDPMIGAHIHELIWKTHNESPRAWDGIKDEVPHDRATKGEWRKVWERVMEFAGFEERRDGRDHEDAGRGATRRPAVAPRTSIIVTHDRDLLRRLRPRVIMLSEGGVCFDGSYDEFARSNDERASAYLRAMPVLQARPLDDDRGHPFRGRPRGS